MPYSYYITFFSNEALSLLKIHKCSDKMALVEHCMGTLTRYYDTLAYPSLVWKSIKLYGKLQEGSLWLIKHCFAIFHFLAILPIPSPPPLSDSRVVSGWSLAHWVMAGWWPDDGWVVVGGGLAGGQVANFLFAAKIFKKKLNTVFNFFKYKKIPCRKSV